ncbi:MAG TPA: homoserine dehydrogenase [Thermomonas sp.]|jgi:homoserine dehydrogenase|nr:homoserine dehydrogenase [Thermomonas sp.]HQY50275.1 homoserine dehydrogenase [Thermomonas sp.]HRA57400.1 homoserine dehydrogenase [Thermomonas sp.]
MSAKLATLHGHPPAPARLALLGTGTVGSAVWARLTQWQGSALGERLRLVHAANSRYALSNSAGLPSAASDVLFQQVPQASSLQAVDAALAGDGVRIVVDATASAQVADQHAHWLARGIHVVTACKLGQGTDLARWHGIQAACEAGNTEYGDSATVGAGLPVLSTLRALQAGGDRIHAIAGVLSGSLAWLFNHYDGMQAFSGFVRQARDAGFTEPDPREDLSGEDVRRKLLILARASGYRLEDHAVQVDSMVPAALADLPRAALDAALPMLDATLRERYATAYKNGEKLRYVARLQAGGLATVGLEALPAEHALVGGGGTDNRIAIWSDRYAKQPLVIQGPGAGAEITAAAILDDALRIQADASIANVLPGRAKNSSMGSGR